MGKAGIGLVLTTVMLVLITVNTSITVTRELIARENSVIIREMKSKQDLILLQCLPRNPEPQTQDTQHEAIPLSEYDRQK